MVGDGPPLVSVGMPVYNGASSVHRAIEAFLNQTLSDLELIICDNASEDETQEICTRYAEIDSRIRYVRNERNIGASRNFNKVFELARGRYFKWAAHDDWVAPDFLDRCVRALETNPKAILCWTGTKFVDELQDVVPEQPLKADPRSLTPDRPIEERFRHALYVHPGPPLFGVIRPEVLRNTGLMRETTGGDRVLVAELSLLGGFGWLPDPLMVYTHYPAARVGYYSASWWNPDHRRHQPARAALRQALQCSAVVARAPLRPTTKATLLLFVARKYGPLAFRRSLAHLRQALQEELPYTAK